MPKKLPCPLRPSDWLSLCPNIRNMRRRLLRPPGDRLRKEKMLLFSFAYQKAYAKRQHKCTMAFDPHCLRIRQKHTTAMDSRMVTHSSTDMPLGGLTCKIERVCVYCP
jgi:hypothetical protein